MINVTKTYLPPVEEYLAKLKETWKTRWVTNQGPLADKLEKDLKEYLGVKNLLLVSNGTIALQLAIKALGLTGEIITTPYSYVATTTSIMWENCKPVFCDIEDGTYCLNPDLIEKCITNKTTGILATHVYGFPCNVEKIKAIAQKNNLKVIYDGAHAFDVKVNGNSIFNFGDISTISFHATKLFHTIEGGAVITDDKELHDLIFQYRMFGHLDEEYISIGINGRTSEFNAAMGLCLLPLVKEFIESRKKINYLYRKLLKGSAVTVPEIPQNTDYNFSYFPVIFDTHERMEIVRKDLLDCDISARRYFYPSLNKLPYLTGANDCPVSESIASRVLCLPVYQELNLNVVERISEIIVKNL